jgi:hypothetical protein
LLDGVKGEGQCQSRGAFEPWAPEREVDTGLRKRADIVMTSIFSSFPAGISKVDRNKITLDGKRVLLKGARLGG